MALANGQLAATAGTLFSGITGLRSAQTINLRVANVGGSTETVVLTMTAAGGTARRFFRAVLSADEWFLYRNLPMDTSMVLLGATSNASSVDYLITEGGNGEESATVYDANGAIKSGSGGLSGAQTFSDDVNFKNAAGTTFAAWDASAISTLWANSPSRINSDPTAFFEVFDDFVYPASATASDVMAWTRTTGAGGTDAFQDAAGGVLNLVTAGTDNDHVAWSSVNELFLFAAGKKLWFEARFKLAEATTNESAWWFGLTDTLTTGGLQANNAGPLASYDGALIWKDEGTMAIDFETSNAGTQATTTAMATFVTNTWTRVGFYFDGAATTSTVTPYYDVGGGVLIAGTPQEITLAGLQEMHVVFGLKAGPTEAAETLQVDYVRCVQIR